jgi:hypothetical protein
LVGIVVGLDYPDQEIAVLRHRMTMGGVADVPVARCIWLNGYPQAVPAFAQPSKTADDRE